MTKNPLIQAHNSAVRMNDTIGKLFSETGSASHLRGYIATAYRMAHRALRSAITENYSRSAARDIFAGLKQSVRSASIPYFLDAQTLGVEESIKQLKLYGFEGGQAMHFQHDYETVNATADVIIAKIEEQEKLVDLCLLIGATDEQILGDDVRQGAPRMSDVAVTAATWAAVLLWDAFSR